MNKGFQHLFFLVPSLMLLCAGCVSMMEKTGQVLDGSAFAEKQTALYRGRIKDGAPLDMEIRETRNRAGEPTVLISLGDYPSMRLRGSAPDGQGEFYLSALHYLGGSVYGWNEYTLDLSGSGKLSLGATEARISIPSLPEGVQISLGKIQRYDTRITGNDALANLRNRRERILAVREWMLERENAPRAQTRKDFENYWKPLLFPEMVSRRKRPPDWRLEGDKFIRAEDIRWNTGYTERVFPEHLRAVRDSGTLFRDWEEALPWIYIEYHWEYIMGLLSREIVLPRKK
jgi:hypothetical protein